MGTTPGESTANSLAEAFERWWDLGGPSADLAAFLAQYPTARTRERAEVVRVDQRRRWRQGCPRPLEDYFRDFPDLAAHPAVRIALIVAEYRTLRRLGQSPDPSAFAARFPFVPNLVKYLERPKGSTAQPTGVSSRDEPRPASREGVTFDTSGPSDEGDIYGVDGDFEPVPDPAWMPPLHETQRDPAPPPPSYEDPEFAGTPVEVSKKRPKTWAERKLAERANRFYKDPSYQSLPWFWEWIAIACQTKRSSWTSRQRDLMTTALWFDLGLSLGVLVVASVVVFGVRAWRSAGEPSAESEVAAAVVEVPRVEKDVVEGYARKLAEVSKEIEAHRTDRAAELLDSVATNLRGWEWHYLKQAGHARNDQIPAKGPMTDVAASADGKRLAACGRFDEPTGRHEGETRQAGYVSLWDVVDGRFRERPSLTRGSPFLRVVLSPDGRLVAAVSESGLTAWEVEGGKELFHLARPGDAIISLAFDAAGTRLAAAERNGQVTVNSVPDGSLLHQLGEMGEGGTKKVAFSPDGQRIAADGGGRLELWDSSDGRSIFRRKQPRRLVSGSVVFSPDGKKVAAEDELGTVRTWAAEDGKELASFASIGDGMDLLAFSPDGKRLAGAAPQVGGVALWDSEDGKEVALFDSSKVKHPTLRVFSGPTSGVAFSPDGRRVGYRVSSPPEYKITEGVMILRSDLKEVQESVMEGGPPRFLASDVVTYALPDSKGQGRIGVWASDGGQLRLEVPLPVVASPDGKILLALGANQILSADDGQVLLSLQPKAHEPIRQAAFSPDGRHFVTLDSEDRLVFWDASTRTPIGEPRKVEERILLFLFSKDGSRMLTQGISRREYATTPGEPSGFSQLSNRFTVSTWDPAKGGQPLATLGGLFDRFTGQPALSPDGTKFAVGSLHQTVRVHDTDSGSLVYDLEGHTQQVQGLAFTPDGHLITSSFGRGSNKAALGETKVWDVARGKSIHNFPGGGVVAQVSPDGQLVFGLNQGVDLSMDFKGLRISARDTNTGDVRYELAVPAGFLAFSPDGGRFAVSTRDSIRIYETTSGTELLKLPITVKESGGSTNPWLTSRDRSKGPMVAGPLGFSKDGRRLFFGGKVGARDALTTNAYVWFTPVASAPDRR